MSQVADFLAGVRFRKAFDHAAAYSTRRRLIFHVQANRRATPMWNHSIRRCDGNTSTCTGWVSARRPGVHRGMAARIQRESPSPGAAGSNAGGICQAGPRRIRSAKPSSPLAILPWVVQP